MTGSNYGSDMSHEEFQKIPLDDLLADLMKDTPYISQCANAGVLRSLEREERRVKAWKKPRRWDWDEWTWNNMSNQ